MDTLGTITPQVTNPSQSEHRTEALERLRYLAHSGNCGLISGTSGTGKTCLLGDLGSQLKREGLAVAQINLAGVGAAELPLMISSRLGSGMSSNVSMIECWMWLQEHAEASRSSGRQLVFLVDHLGLSDETMIAPLSRMMDAFGTSCAWIFAAGDSLSAAWKEFLSQRIWLRVDLKNLEQRESMQLLSRDLLQRGSPARFTADGIEAAQNLSQGRIRHLRQLAELASVAAEIEGVTQINADIVRALANEFV